MTTIILFEFLRHSY